MKTELHSKIEAFIAKHGEDTALSDLPDREFNFGSDLSDILRLKNEGNNPRAIVNESNSWSMSVGTFLKF